MRKAVFIDLLGTLGGNPTSNTYGFEFFPYAISAIKKLNDNNILVFIITNQSHIGKGIMSAEDFNEHVINIKQALNKAGGYWDGFYYCPHVREDNCDCKKPNDGMIRQVQEDYDSSIDLENSYVVGDMGMSDMLLAKSVGAKGILVLTGAGLGSIKEFRYTWKDYEAEYIAKDINEAVDYILSNNKLIGK